MLDTLWRVGACISKLGNFCNLSNQTAISAIRLQSQQSEKNTSQHAWVLVQGCGTICKLRNFCNLSNQTAISAIRLQSQQSDCNLHNQTAISAIRLQSYIAVSGLHLDYTERKIQYLGNVLKVLAHGVHQAVRFTWVWLLQDYLKIASNCFGLLGLHLDC